MIKTTHIKKITLPFLTLMTMLIASCSYDSESDLIEVTELEMEITYNDNIAPIIGSNCLGCHSSPPQNGAPFPLTNYNQVLVRAENGQLLDAISKQTGEPGAMPPSGRLAQTTIDLVEQWINEGFVEE